MVPQLFRLRQINNATFIKLSKATKNMLGVSTNSNRYRESALTHLK
ncbi:hypothetical protein pipiens_016547, partial [Culex pipiens pipiens]